MNEHRKHLTAKELKRGVNVDQLVEAAKKRNPGTKGVWVRQDWEARFHGRRGVSLEDLVKWYEDGVADGWKCSYAIQQCIDELILREVYAKRVGRVVKAS